MSFRWGSLPLLAEVVHAQRGRQTAALLVADGGGHQHDGGDDEGEGLIDLRGDGGQPAQRAGEGGSQRGAGDTQGVEEAEDEGTYNGQSGVPVGKDDQRHGDPAVAVDPAAGVEGAGHVEAHVVAADAHDAAAQADVQILHALDVDTHRVGSAGVLAHSPQLQAGGGAVEVPPHDKGDDDAKIDQHIVIEDAVAQQRNLRQAGNGQVGKAILDVGVVAHDRPCHSLQAVAHKEVDTQTEGGQSQTGDVLVGLQGDGEGGEEQAAQGGCQESHGDAHAEGVGVAAADVAEDGTHGHDTLHAQIQAAGLLDDNLAHGAVEQRNVVDHNVVNEGGQYSKLIHFHVQFPPFLLRTTRKRVRKSAASTRNRITP